MTDRISASALTQTTRVKVEDLTPMELDALSAMGQVGPEGFLDIEKPVEAPMVDFKAEARKTAVTQLRSVVDHGRQRPQGIPGDLEIRAMQAADAKNAAALEELTKELAAAQTVLASRSPCPRCGLGIKESCEVVASTGDVEEFLKCVLSGSQFSKAYKLFGGRLTVTLGTRDGAVDDLVRRVVTDALRTKEIVSETEVFAMMRQLTAAAALRSYTSKDIDIQFPDLPSGSPSEFKEAAMARMAKIPAQIQNALRPTITDFHVLVDILTARANDPNFW